uniref:Uncharacterized protein n=2 Tax=Cacopsylla melanoneura TaxID=428564 RepID=A0A8D8WU95_9HEMI
MADVEPLDKITTKKLKIELRNYDKSSFKTSSESRENAENSNLRKDQNSNLDEAVHSNLTSNTEQQSKSEEKVNPTSDMFNDTMKIVPRERSEELMTTVLSFHDQIALSLERHMKMIDENEDLGSYSKDDHNNTDFKNNTKQFRLSEELADYKNFLAYLKHSDDYNATEGLVPKNNIFENETNSTESSRNQFENEKEIETAKFYNASLELKNEREDDKCDNSLTDQYKTDHNIMNHSRHLNPQDLTTRPYDVHNRIEKRSVPNMNSEFHEIDDHKTRTEMLGSSNKTLSMSREEKNHQDEKPILPGADKFWDFFITSPVAVILNSTTIYEKAGLYNPEMKDYEKEYYDKVVKTLREKQGIQDHEERKDNEHHEEDASVEQHDRYRSVEHSKQLNSVERETKQNTIHTEQGKTFQNYGSDEIGNLLGPLVNRSSLQKDIDYNLMEKSKEERVTIDPKERLSPEKYAEFLELKKSLDLQYKDLKEHMNKTDRHIERIFIEMRNLKEEKMLNDYFEHNELLFTHYSTPHNYSNTVDVFNIATEPYVNPFSWENASDFMPDKINERSTEEVGDGHQFEDLENFNDKHFSVTPDPENEKERAEMEEHLRRLLMTTMNTNGEMYKITSNTEKYDYESLERYDKKKYQEVLKMELEQKDGLIGNISKDHIEHIHANLMKRLNKTRPSNVQRTTIKPNTVTPKLWFEESVFDQNDPKIVYAKYLHNVRNMTVRLNMEVGKKYIKNITYFNKEDRRYAHQYKSTTECRRFSHIIPFWLTQPKEIEDVFKGNTKIFREYIQYILDKHNFTELPVNGRFAFVRKYINKLNNPLIFNRITIFPTAYITTDHVLSLKDQMKHFKGHLKSKIHKAYKHVKHFLFNSSLDEAHDHVPIIKTDTIPDEVIINITTPPAVGPYYDYY